MAITRPTHQETPDDHIVIGCRVRRREHEEIRRMAQSQHRSVSDMLRKMVDESLMAYRGLQGGGPAISGRGSWRRANGRSRS
jgi:hypothetical protein